MTDLTDLAGTLRQLLPWWNMAVVRGEILDQAHAVGVRRLLYPDPKTGEAATLRDVARRWPALDMEDIVRPAGIPVTDLAACARLALNTLPTVFSDAACVVQASGSHGFKPDIRLRLWFWCDRPVMGAELKRWLRNTPADLCVFGAAQPIYTARPVMVGDGVEAIPDRLTMLPGKPEVAIPSSQELKLPSRYQPPLKKIHPAQVSHYARAALVKAADRIMHASKRHPTIIAECRGLARLVFAGLISEDDLRAVVMAAAEHAGKDNQDKIASCVAWGLAHPAGGPIPETPNGR